MRDFSKQFSEKQLKTILYHLEELRDFPYEDYDEYIFEQVDDIVKYFGISNLEWDETSFFIKLLELNPNYEKEPIRVPKLNHFVVNVSVDLTESVVEIWKHNVNTYFDEKDKTLIDNQLTNYNDWSYWEGDQVHKEYYDSNVNDLKIERIYKRKE